MRVVMTGAAGGVGTMTRPHLEGHFDQLVVSDRRQIAELQDGETFVQADLTDLAAVERLLRGRRRHHPPRRAARSRTPGSRCCSNNIIGGYNMFEAARRQGVRRIVFATTNHVVGFYRRQRTIDHTVMPRPDSRYGVSKAFGEALGRMYADKYGLGVLNIRIGNVWAEPADRAAAVDLDQPARSRAADADRARPSGRSTSRSSTASPTTRAPGTTTATPAASATGRRTSAEDYAASATQADLEAPARPDRRAVPGRRLLHDGVQRRRQENHMSR